jgi:hypothetical protein
VLGRVTVAAGGQGNVWLRCCKGRCVHGVRDVSGLQALLQACSALPQTGSRYSCCWPVGHAATCRQALQGAPDKMCAARPACCEMVKGIGRNVALVHAHLGVAVVGKAVDRSAGCHRTHQRRTCCQYLNHCRRLLTCTSSNQRLSVQCCCCCCCC